MSSTSVFEAAAAGDIEYLKSHSSELSTKNDRGWTPLHFAARYGQLEVVTYLVDKKVPTEITNSEGKVRNAPSGIHGKGNSVNTN
jgi:NAD+ diphosphatase